MSHGSETLGAYAWWEGRTYGLSGLFWNCLERRSYGANVRVGQYEAQMVLRFFDRRWGRGIALTLYCCSLSPGCYNTTDVNGEYVIGGENDTHPSESLAAPSRDTPQTQPEQKSNYQYTSLLFKMTRERNQTRRRLKYEMATHLKSPLGMPLNPSSSSSQARLVRLRIDNIEQIKRIVESRRLEALHHLSNITTRGCSRSWPLSFPAPTWRIGPACTRTDGS